MTIQFDPWHLGLNRSENRSISPTWKTTNKNGWNSSGWSLDIWFLNKAETTTVDGSEIWRSPVEVSSLSHYLQGFSIIPGGCLEFLPSTVGLGFNQSLGNLQPKVVNWSIPALHGSLVPLGAIPVGWVPNPHLQHRMRIRCQCCTSHLASKEWLMRDMKSLQEDNICIHICF